MANLTTILDVYRACSDAIRNNKLIHKVSETDKEFHFQNWAEERIIETGYKFDQGGRNSYPDFRMVATTEGYEIKGLAYPGRVTNFDSNSQVPSGYHNGRTIYYVFGRYPRKPDGSTYPVLDLVICHGDFLNADHEYTHKNKNLKGFGSYGDIMIRDRKMYVVPTPFSLINGVAHTQTLIMPEGFRVTPDFHDVGTLVRKEAENLIVGYTFNLRNNDIKPEIIPNPTSAREHVFKAWRLDTYGEVPLKMREANEHDIENIEDMDDYE